MHPDNAIKVSRVLSNILRLRCNLLSDPDAILGVWIGRSKEVNYEMRYEFALNGDLVTSFSFGLVDRSYWTLLYPSFLGVINNADVYDRICKENWMEMASAWWYVFSCEQGLVQSNEDLSVVWELTRA